MSGGSVAPGVRRRWVAVDHPGWAQAHASSTIAHRDRVLCAWFGGTREGTPDNRIWLAARPSDGEWGEPRPLVAADVAHWNPVLAEGPSGDLWLFFKRGERISEWRTLVIRSSDGGATWSAPEELVPGDRSGGRGPVKNPPLRRADGTWLAPGSVEEWGARPTWSAFVDRSSDGGRTWSRIPLPLDRARLRGAGVIQPALWEEDGEVVALARSTEGSAFLSRSRDGETWTPLEPTALANNNSGLTALAVAPGLVACVHNPVSGDWAARCPLSVSLSRDGGRTWREAVTIEDGATPVPDEPLLAPSAPSGAGSFAGADSGVVTDGSGEYSYPSACLVDGGLLITYTWQRRGIVEALVPRELLAA
ncbi:sialidase family protein [Microbacterium sp. gxy059]|uniref:sialidase family protein n=1 Tax=Microbacterium sp. gxy059 TaxID=2957199 RepID=UPI003D959573